jgi:hypothetical protein
VATTIILSEKGKDNAQCLTGYTPIDMKTKKGKKVPNCPNSKKLVKL